MLARTAYSPTYFSSTFCVRNNITSARVCREINNELKALTFRPNFNGLLLKCFCFKDSFNNLNYTGFQYIIKIAISFIIYQA